MRQELLHLNSGNKEWLQAQAATVQLKTQDVLSITLGTTSKHQLHLRYDQHNPEYPYQLTINYPDNSLDEAEAPAGEIIKVGSRQEAQLGETQMDLILTGQDIADFHCMLKLDQDGVVTVLDQGKSLNGTEVLFTQFKRATMEHRPIDRASATRLIFDKQVEDIDQLWNAVANLAESDQANIPLLEADPRTTPRALADSLLPFKTDKLRAFLDDYLPTFMLWRVLRGLYSNMSQAERKQLNVSLKTAHWQQLERLAYVTGQATVFETDSDGGRGTMTTFTTKVLTEQFAKQGYRAAADLHYYRIWQRDGQWIIEGRMLVNPPIPTGLENVSSTRITVKDGDVLYMDNGKFVFEVVDQGDNGQPGFTLRWLGVNPRAVGKSDK